MKNLYFIAIISFILIPVGNVFAQNDALQAFINSKSVEIKDIRNPNDYGFLKKIGKNTELVGIGEASHGSETLFEIRNTAFKYLVENQGFTIFLMEEDYGDLLAINKAIMAGEGDLEKLVKESKLNGFWKTEAYLNIFKWMQNHNKSRSKNKLQVIGVDCQDVRSAISYVKENYPALFKNQSADIPAFLNSWEFIELSKMEKTKIDQLYEQGQKLFNELKNSPEFRRNQSKIEYKIVLNSFETVVQALALNTSRTTREEMFEQYKKFGFLVKDKRSEFMAKNALRVIRDFKGKAVLAAHNAHVFNYAFSEDTGYFLKKELGGKYFIIGTDFAFGSIQAFGNDGLKLVEVDKPETSSLADYFSKTGKNSLFLMLPDKKSDSANILTTEKRISSMPGAYKTIFEKRYINLQINVFDAFIYTEKIEPIRMLRNH